MLGTALAFAALTLGGVARRLLHAAASSTELDIGGTERRPAGRRTRSSMESMRFLWPLIAVPQVFLASFGAYWWLAVDTPYRVTSCQNSDGGSATCFDGEPAYRLMTLIFLVVAAALLAVWAVTAFRSQGRDRRFDRAWRDGVHTQARLVDSDRTNTRVNNGRVYAFTYEIVPADGATPIRFVQRGTSSPAGQIGGSVPAVYDPGHPEDAFIVDQPRSAALV